MSSIHHQHVEQYIYTVYPQAELVLNHGSHPMVHEDDVGVVVDGVAVHSHHERREQLKIIK